MLGVFNLDWLSHNATRAYPVAADATQVDLTGEFTLPTSFLVSLYLSVHAGLDVTPGDFFIRQVGSYSTGFSILIAYQSTSGPVNVASALISRALHMENQVYALKGLGDFADATGHLVIGSLDDIDTQPAGLFSFDLAGGRLEPDAIRPMIRGVQSIRLVNGTDESEPLTGDIVLVAGANMRLTPIVTPGEDPVIRFDAVEGEGLIETCECIGTTAPPIRFINGVGPNPDGTMLFLGDDCLQISGLSHGLQLRDACSQPCCGCRELEILTSALEEFGQQATTLENFLTALQASVETMNQVVLGSRLGDACVSCD